MRMRSAAALSAARMTSTVMGSSAIALPPADLDHEAPVLFDRQRVAGIDDGRRPRLFDGGGAFDRVAGQEIGALDHAVLDEVARDDGVNRSRLDGEAAPGATRARRQPWALDREDDRQPQIH